MVEALVANAGQIASQGRSSLLGASVPQNNQMQRTRSAPARTAALAADLGVGPTFERGERLATRDHGLRRTARLVLAAALLSIGCGPSREDIGGVIDRAAPLVRAIHAYVADQGHPPPALGALVPKYLPGLPTTGLAAFPSFEYDVGPDDPHRWRLTVRLESLGFRHLRYDPRRQYEIPVTELHDGWVTVTP